MKPAEFTARPPEQPATLAGLSTVPLAGNWNGLAKPLTATKKVLTGLFALVGVANTVLDFAIYNALTSNLAGWARIPANVVSTSVAMTLSFVVNLFWVFSPQRSLVPRRAWRFIWVTSCALYGVQNLVIWLTSGVWSAPVDQLAAQATQLFALGAGSEDLIARNLVKGFATAASMTWNYFWYRFYVYREH